ncbi:hypothetical protein Y032_0030g2183 [Ancylostoma ceylanicum]|uniref:SCP domain-containing protein n=1 Tax=Ancylostoma ceylanicum TaxID=53326 RepID=A0A016URT4_9BILA|nr:hypothetical protein Y032_0030g2183 [Ancylostoma ceylanicum]
MLCLYLFTFAAVPLSAASYLGGAKPPANCAQPIKFPKGKSEEIVKKINERRRVMVEGNQRNGKSGLNLPTGENVMEMEWNCDLERKAMAALGGTCPTQSPSAPSGTTGFFDYKDVGIERDSLNLWLSEIENDNIVLYENREAPVKYNGVNKNYCNLVRYDASQIGCAATECGGKRSLFCLIDRP